MYLCFIQIFFLWLISSFIVLWSEKMHGMTSIFFNFLRLVLWVNMWSILANVPCVLEKNVYSAVLGGNILNMFVRSNFDPTLECVIQSHCLLFDFQFGISTDISGVLKSPIITYHCQLLPLCLIATFCVWVLLSWVDKHLQLLLSFPWIVSFI